MCFYTTSLVVEKFSVLARESVLHNIAPMSSLRYGELQKFHNNEIANSVLPTFINSLAQIWFHLGYFRSLVYQSDPFVLEQVAKAQFADQQVAKYTDPTEREQVRNSILAELNTRSAKGGSSSSSTVIEQFQELEAERENRSVICCLREIFARLQNRTGLASAAKLISAYPFLSTSTAGAHAQAKTDNAALAAAATAATAGGLQHHSSSTTSTTSASSSPQWGGAGGPQIPPRKDLESFMMGLFSHILSELDTGTSSSSTSGPSPEESIAALAKKNAAAAKKLTTAQALYKQLDKLQFEWEWAEYKAAKPTVEPVSQKSPVFPLFVRGFRRLEDCLDFYFGAKVGYAFFKSVSADINTDVWAPPILTKDVWAPPIVTRTYAYDVVCPIVTLSCKNFLFRIISISGRQWVGCTSKSEPPDLNPQI